MTLALGLFLAPLAATEQPRGHIPLVGVLSPATSEATSESALGLEALRQGLRDLGYVEGQTILVEYRRADWQLDRLPVLGIAVAVVSTVSEATSKRIHVTAQLVQQTCTGKPTSPRLGDRRITNVDLLDKSGTRVGTGGVSWTIVSVPPLDTLEECLLTAVCAQGQIIFGGLAPLAEIGAVAQFGMLGGTDDFRQARGDVMLVVTTTAIIDVTFDLDRRSARRIGHGTGAPQFTAE